MRFLVDNSVSPYLSNILNEDFESQHVRDIGMAIASDDKIFSHALKNEQIIISADTDFSWILSKQQSAKPSLILFRKGAERDPIFQGSIIKDIILNFQEELKAGCIITIEIDRVRIRSLPIY